MKEFTEFGKHFLVELSDCDPSALSDVEAVKAVLLDAARRSDATIIDHHFHQFQPHGVSGVILIAESHFSIHTWPESGYVAIDIFTCGSQLKPRRAISLLRKSFGAKEAMTKTVSRGAALGARPAPAVPASGSPTSSTLLYALTLIIAACSIVYELLIAQTISLLAANTVKWYSLTIGVFLCSMGVGSFLSDSVARRRNPWNVLFWVECSLAIIGFAAVPLLRFGHMFSTYFLGNQAFPIPEIPFFVAAFGTMAAIGLLSGLEIPLLIRIVNRERQKSLVNRILGVDYLGALIGGFAFPLLLLPYFSVLSIGITVAVVNFLMAMAIQFSRPSKKAWHVPAWSAVTAAVLCVAAFGFTRRDDVQQYFLQRFYYSQFMTDSISSLLLPNPDLPRVKRYQSPYQRIDVVESAVEAFPPALLDAYSTKFEENPSYPRGMYLYLNGDFQLVSDTEEIYHEYFAHVPVLRAGQIPRRVLVLGGGDGMLIRELLKYSDIEQITHVDLDPVLVELAETKPLFLEMNEGALLDDRVENIFDDGFQFVRHTQEKFDAIYIDFPYAVDYNLSKLYSKEFYYFVRHALAPGGFGVIDSPGVGTFSEPDLAGRQVIAAENDWPIYGQTLKAAGFKTIIPYVSNLEVENERALELVRSSIEPEALNLDGNPYQLTMREAAVQDLMARQMLASHVYTLQQGFILFSNDDLPARQYNDPGIKLHVLNPLRYRKAFELSFPALPDRNPTAVNSIMKPSLPNLPFWFIRTP